MLPDDRIGRCGLEAEYDDDLRGTPGKIVNERDEDGGFTVRRVVKPPERGDDVRLHLTAAACVEATDALRSVATDAGFLPGGPASGGFVMMDAETGAVLAWAETPTFDLNDDIRAVSAALDEGDALEEASRREGTGEPVAFASPIRPALAYSRVARLAVEPGSCQKLVTGITLLESGHPLDEHYVCAGTVRRSVNDYPRCSHDHENPVNVESAEEHSCNRFFADMSSASAHLAQHRELFQTWRRRLGIGEPPSADLRAARGRYPANLDRGTIRQVAIGQGMTATPLQMVRVAALLQNGHHLPFPRVAATVGDREVKGGGVEVALDPSTLRRLRTGMRAVVRTGTAKRSLRRPAGPRGRRRVRQDGHRRGDRPEGLGRPARGARRGRGGGRRACPQEAVPPLVRRLRREARPPPRRVRHGPPRAGGGLRRRRRGPRDRAVPLLVVVAMTYGERLKKASWAPFVLALALTAVGLLMIAIATEGHARSWALLQLRWAVVGACAALLVLAIPYQRLVQARARALRPRARGARPRAVTSAPARAPAAGSASAASTPSRPSS